MKSSSLRLDKRRRTFVRLIGEIRHALNRALEEESQSRGLTRAAIARILNTNKSFVTRKFNGTSNMTLETLADLAYALDRPIKVELPSRAQNNRSNYFVGGDETRPSTNKAPPINPQGESIRVIENAA